ncbi:hypothetical protein AB0451_25785 [Streptomyces sp. NPDC052000]|uniref:hypothetical protein n=1 Tax=Streptomyces sp. NPDC052000 TaxID=3155676 RepID=UPI00344D618E
MTAANVRGASEMAWDEWEQLKADAAVRRQHQMRLDGAGAGDRGGANDLKTNGSGKAAAVKALRVDIRPGTDKAGRHTEEGSAEVARAFSGWAFGSALGDAQNEWGLQVDNLKDRLAADQTALEQTKQDFKDIDHGVKSQVAQIHTAHLPRHEV